MIVEIFTDGACKGNPGPGGWGAILRYKNHEKKIYGADKVTTNNRMELMAAIKALTTLKRSCQVELYTDSQYLRRGMTEWLPQWQKNSWRNSRKKPIKNEDLWKMLANLAQKHNINWHWIRGHSGHPENEEADSLANLAINELTKL